MKPIRWAVEMKPRGSEDWEVKLLSSLESEARELAMTLQSTEFDARVVPLVVAPTYAWKDLTERDEEELLKIYVQFNMKPRGLIHAVHDFVKRKNVKD